MVRAGLYARVSREEQAAGYSIDTQLNSMWQYAEGKGWEGIEFTEPGHTARTDDRPVFQELMARASAGDLDVVMVHRLDRGFRNLEDQLRDLRCLRELGVAFVSVQEGFDDSSSHGRFTQNIKGAVNQYYSDLLSEKIRDGKQARVKAGLPNSTIPPFGYVRVDGRDVPDPEAVKGVVIAFEAYASGNHSDATVARLMNEAGIPTSSASKKGKWTHATARHLLMNRYYLGEVRHRSEWYPGQHQPIVPRELFDQAQQVRARRATNRRGGPKGRVYLLHRVARCFHCGRYLYVSPSRNPKGELRPQYKEPGKVLLTDCPAAGRHVRQNRIDEQVEALVKRLKLPDDWRDRLEELNEHREERQGVEKRQAYLQGKLRRLRELYIDGDFDKPEYDRRKGELQDQLDALTVPDAPDVMEAGATLETLGQIWEDASLRIRRDMLRTIFEGIYVDMQTARVVYVKPWPPFVGLFRMDGLEEKEDGCFHYQEDEET